MTRKSTEASTRPTLKTRPGVGRPAHARRPSVKRAPRPEPDYVVVSDIGPDMPITSREIDAIEMFLGGEIDKLLGEAKPGGHK